MAAYDAVFSGTELTSDGDLSWTHTPVGTPTEVIVGLALLSSDPAVTYGGTAMSPITEVAPGYAQVSSGPNILTAWYLRNPPSGAQTVAVAHTASASSHRKTGISLSFTGSAGVPTEVTTNTSDPAATSDITAGINVANTLTNDLIVSFFLRAGGGGTATIDPITGQTEAAEVTNGTANALNAMYEAADGGTHATDVDVATAIEWFIHLAFRLPAAPSEPGVIWYN
jgi:hypothetical protein